jgi:hypothetical protein
MIAETTIAASTIAILAPYLAETGKEFAKKAGGKLADKAASIYQLIKDKFKGDDEAEQTLALVEARPESKARLATLEEVLVDRIQGDAEFSQTLHRLIEEAKKAASQKIFVRGDRNIAAGGEVKGSIIIAGDSNEVNR